MSRKIFALAALMVMMPVMMGAQALKGSYFLESSLDRHRLNPAFAPETGYFKLPAIGGFSVGLTSNLELATFMYPVDGQLATFLHKDVSLEKFDAVLPNNPYLNLQTDLNFVSFGKRGRKAFWSVDVGIRALADVNLSRDLFMFLKKGSGISGAYNLGPVRANVSGLIHASFGYSRDLYDVVPGLRVGAKVRGLLPVVHAALDYDNLTLNASPDKWTVDAEGKMKYAFKGVNLVDEDGNFMFDMPGTPGLIGWGLSMDLGAEYKLEFDGFINGLAFSASVLDLGFVKYNKQDGHVYTAGGQIDWTGMMISLKEGSADEMPDYGEEFGKLIDFQESGEEFNVKNSTLPSVYVGVEMPFCNKLMSLGALYSAKSGFYNMRSELTLSYNLTPAKWFSLGMNYSFLNTAKSMGCILELTPRIGPCISVGVDYFPLEWAPSPDTGFDLRYIPTSACVNAHVGISFAIGGKHTREAWKRNK